MNAKTNALTGKLNGLTIHGMNAGVVGKTPVSKNVKTVGKWTAQKNKMNAGTTVKDVTTP